MDEREECDRDVRLEGEETHVESQLALNAICRHSKSDPVDFLGLLLAATINDCIIGSCDLVRLATRLLDPTGGVGFIEFENGILDSVAVCAGRTVASTVVIFFLLAVLVEVEVVDGQVGVVVRVRVVVGVRVVRVPDTAVAATVGTRVDTRRWTGPLLQ